MKVKDIIQDLSYRVRFGGFKLLITASEEFKEDYKDVLGKEWEDKTMYCNGYIKHDDGSITVGEKYIGQKRVRSQIVNDNMIVDYIRNNNEQEKEGKVLIIKLDI